MTQEYSIDLTAQELMESPVLDAMTEIEDIGALDVFELDDVANMDQPPVAAISPDDSMEIELSAQEIDALLGALPRT
jgi:hypothetical protein